METLPSLIALPATAFLEDVWDRFEMAEKAGGLVQYMQQQIAAASGVFGRPSLGTKGSVGQAGRSG